MDELRIILPESAGGILAAVSGGADSVAMLALLCEAAKAQNVRLAAAHFEHGIRGEESIADAAFVRALCDEWQIPLMEGEADVPALARVRSTGIEEAARDARYAFLRKARRQTGADYIALAHHRDDQAETVLMHLLRGTGLRGLVGMKELEEDLYRPLLRFSKETLVSYLQERRISWREDATNTEQDNPRNGLRLAVIPQAERFYPGAKRAICRFSEIATVEDDYMSAETDRFLEKSCVRLPYGWLIALGGERVPHRAILMRAAHRLTGLAHDSVVRAVALADQSRGAAELSGGWRAERGRNGLYLLCGTPEGMKAQPLPEEGEIELGALGRIIVRAGAGIPVRDNPFCQELDADALDGAVVRTRMDGDRIRPMGAPGSQKLKEYFINRHVDRAVRDMIPLIARGSDVLWVMGEGISEQAKLRLGSRAVRLTLTDWPLQKFGGKNNA